MPKEISIHAPHEGCDREQRKKAGEILISIHAPHEGCDREQRKKAGEILISIHAPHEGCDRKTYGGIGYQAGFQSTHPMRGATE